ncbi:DUF262 domain-containing protein [Arachidicoccus terrestris]|uniref:DUF262 domain-containing protein n=1 Tax=Arachidicoccus terrestris TaxID=2875539 RepID=UPI001CC359DA|nr:DUF262 domain-containing protein [Arachidicoccus terrestris]UAY55781.1 DUF262 domain-containing protein [Arachidicoccus terrestris]
MVIDNSQKIKIEQKFETAQNSLVLQQSDLSLQSVSDMVANESIDISPKYQRRERWNDDKESELIESFLLNIPVPPIYLAEDEYGIYSVIDGKQRITAIHKFLSGNLKLKNLNKFQELDGLYFSDLPLKLSNALKIRPYLRVVTLLRQSDPDLKHEVFLRLNKAGVPLNSQEIRNVAYRGNFNDLLFELSEETYLKQQLKSTRESKNYKEMIDVQYVLRFFTIREYWKSFHGNMDKAMDEFMAKNYKNDPSTVAAQKRIFKNALKFCETIWGNEGFMKPDSNRRIMQGFFDIQMVCCTFLNEAQYKKAMKSSAKVKSGLKNLLKNDKDFEESVSQFTSNAKNVQKRISTFINVLKQI